MLSGVEKARMKVLNDDMLVVFFCRRDADLQIEKMVGKSLVVSSTSALNAQGGYYCKVCDCTVKDSMSWLDHVNGKKHNRNMGMSMRVERATLEDVQAKMKQYKPSDRKVCCLLHAIPKMSAIGTYTNPWTTTFATPPSPPRQEAAHSRGLAMPARG